MMHESAAVASVPELLSHETLQRHTQELLRRSTRPDPRQVAGLVQAGLTSEDIVAAGQVIGYEPPRMDKTLQELPYLIGYMQQASDVLARDPQPKIFAARDAEYMYDDYAIRYPYLPADLLNASGPLFQSIYRALGEGDPELPRERIARFFSAYGLTDESLRQHPRTVVDTGFRGTIGRDLSSTILRLRGEDFGDLNAPVYLQNGLLTVKLLSARQPSSYMPDPVFGSEILDSSLFPENVKTGDAFPKTIAFLGKGAFAGSQPSAALATAVQLLPHYTHEYGTLIERDGASVEAISLRQVEPIRAHPDVDTGYYKGVNVSICHPVAALVVQSEVVRRALATGPAVSQ